jgi:uncharacterized protein YjcR
MRTHKEIIRAAGIDTLADHLGVSVHTVRSWAQRGSIPAEYWAAMAKASIATLEELAAAAALKREASDQEAA